MGPWRPLKWEGGAALQWGGVDTKRVAVQYSKSRTFHLREIAERQTNAVLR